MCSAIKILPSPTAPAPRRADIINLQVRGKRQSSRRTFLIASASLRLRRAKASHTRAWSRKVAGADAFVFVTPQYNWGYPAALKNAIDHLYQEWAGKPLMLVSYGGHGGDKCAAQLRQVAEGVKSRPVQTMPAIVLTREMIAGGPVDPDKDFHAHVEDVRRAFGELVAQLKE